MRIWVVWRQSEWQVLVRVDALFCKCRWKSDILFSSDYFPNLVDKPIISRIRGTLFTSTLDVNFLDRYHRAVTHSVPERTISGLFILVPPGKHSWSKNWRVQTSKDLFQCIKHVMIRRLIELVNIRHAGDLFIYKHAIYFFPLEAFVAALSLS